MSTAVSSIPPSSSTESKSARKKKAKADVAASPAPSKGRTDSSSGLESSDKVNGGEAVEHPYVVEIRKQVRKINKSLSLMEKLDKIREENPGQSLDDLVAAKKINNDQRAQGLRKPVLISQREEYNEQLKKFAKFVEDYEEKLVKQRESLTSTHTTSVEAVRAEVTKEVKKEMEIEFKRRLLTFTRFLKAAAGRRQIDEDSEESKAFESVLCGVYAGDAAAVDCAESLVNGSEEKVPEYTGPVNVTYAKVKELSLAEAPIEQDPWANGETDPTIANAGLNELDNTEETLPIIHTNGTTDHTDDPDTPVAPAATSIQEGTGNAAAEEHWDSKVPGDVGMEESFELVQAPTETETPAETPAVTSTPSWADDTPVEPQAAAGPPATENDGFSEVVHNNRGGRGRGGSEQRGGYRGRGGTRGDGYRGRGRGDGRGRGRGEGRGRGAPRSGAPRGESSS
ncbi:Transcription factor CBF NF-Y histone domain-containing [Venturia nashicola]|uniref:Transcription factor CBF NF-Y histone domain-containing n=1 Tax=Venturia nashicola TaxID=86259 RepID=A0A4Z1NVZ9_9PEZI|nr:Transcription factor CBF NF-Y histone domain-containing [Venturia nashicola]TLD31928.1 Transcription factor CBF NF-Y histone domain-containing [Venturia nashicola]